MTKEEIDILWNKAMRLSIEDGDQFTRYRFAALVATHVRETEFKPDWNNYQQGLADGAAAERNSWPAEMEAMERQVNILTDALAQAKAEERKIIMDSLQKQADLAVDDLDRRWALEMKAAIRARGETK